MELPEHDLAVTTSLPVQLQFYQEAGVKVAAFMGCESGEIEVGMSIPAGQMNLQASLGQVFSEDFFQQSLLEELLQLPPTRPSSSSSSLPSISVGSPADGSTSLQRSTMAAMSSSATTSPRELTVAPRPPHPVPFSRHGPGHGHVHFPSAEADDVAMAQAMLTVISSSSTSSSAMSTTSMPIVPGNHRARRSPRRGTTTTAFRAYNAALAPRAPRLASGAAGQRMIKMGMSILRRMHEYSGRERTTRVTATQGWREDHEETAAASAPPAPTSSQLHHMISERRRRERLNESFETLRGLLPPGSKKDKATVLANTLDYMSILMAQISELEAKNRSLQAAAAETQQQHQRIGNGNSRDRTLLQAGRSSERVQVEVTTTSSASASTSSSAAEYHEVTIRVAAPGDLSELVSRVLALLKDTAGHRLTLVAVEGWRPDATGGGIAQASLTLRATAAGELDEASLREAVAKAVVGLVTPPPPSDDDESP